MVTLFIAEMARTDVLFSYINYKLQTHKFLPQTALAVLLSLLVPVQDVIAQNEPFLEDNGLVVIQAESVPLAGDWVFESSDAGYTGSGYLRWDGPNHYGNPGVGTLAYKVFINEPGEYNVRLRISHLGAPAGDQWNDVWVKMNDGTWVKTLHPANRKDEGFTFHSPTEPSSGVFSQLRFDLSNGEHTLYISGRSTNLRMDRIHFYKDGTPNPENLALPESERGTGVIVPPPPPPEPEATIEISGDLKKWHPVTLTLDGPETSESGSTNPFLDYRFDVKFSQEGRSFTVPGYFAADGDAAETGSDAGNKWRAHFMPDQPGTWDYQISFRSGAGVAVNTSATAGTATDEDGVTGSFTVEETDKAGRDHRGKGKLRYVDGHYLQFDNGEYYLKGGANSPENLLAYADFDSTYSNGPKNYIKEYQNHVSDWQEGDPTWRDGKGKGIIGALNYLSDKEMNAVYFITMNVQGDGQDVWPWRSHSDRLRYDVSKLAQWDVVFNHMDQKGLMLHFQLQETENEKLLDGGNLGTTRKLYFRELIARFGYHHAITWNLGEENDEQTDAQRKASASYIRELDAYNHPIVIHTFPGEYDRVYGPFLGHHDFEGPSLQLHGVENTYDETLKWRLLSAENGRPWIVSLDEFGPYQIGVTEDGPESNHDEVRKHALWGNLMAGGAGVEWYFGYETGSNDLNAEDWRTRDGMWDYTRHALTFFQTHLPFNEMVPLDSVAGNRNTYVFAKPGELYAVYGHHADSIQVDLAYGEYELKWFNPRTGGELEIGEQAIVNGPGLRSIGNPPADSSQDWVALLTNTGNPPQEPRLAVVPRSLDFGEIAPGDSLLLPITLENYGNLPLQVDSLVITGEHASRFSFVDTPEALTLDEGLTTTFELQLQTDSTAIDSISAFIQVFSNDPVDATMEIPVNAFVVDPTEAHPMAVTRLVLVDADTDLDVRYLASGDTLDLSILPPHLNVRADVFTEEGQRIRNVVFNLSPENVTRKEVVAPYLLFGDIGGDYRPGTFNLGDHTLTATPFGLDGKLSEPGKALTISFFVTGYNDKTKVAVQSGSSEEDPDGDFLLDDSGEVVDGYQLEANYPNPFNPTTTLAFSLPETTHVRLVVYDMLGRQVKVLLDRQMQSGRQEVQFDAIGLPSGTYIYAVQTPEWSDTRQMILLK